MVNAAVTLILLSRTYKWVGLQVVTMVISLVTWTIPEMGTGVGVGVFVVVGVGFPVSVGVGLLVGVGVGVLVGVGVFVAVGEFVGVGDGEVAG